MLNNVYDSKTGLPVNIVDIVIERSVKEMKNFGYDVDHVNIFTTHSSVFEGMLRHTMGNLKNQQYKRLFDEAAEQLLQRIKAIKETNDVEQA